MVVRRTFVLVSLVGMLGATMAMGHTRMRDVDAAPPSPTPAHEPDVSIAEAEPAATPKTSTPEQPNRPVYDAPLVGPDPAPLRVVGLGWEILAPGILANDGATPGPSSHFEEVGLTVTFDAVTDVEDLQRRLGRGGHDEAGADIALLPYPEFVAAYERLRALSPQVFFVVGWSRGRDVVLAERPDALQRPVGKDVVLEGAPGRASTLLGLFALDRAGVPMQHVTLHEPAPASDGSPRARRSTTLQAVQRSHANPSALDARKLVLSTAEATHLVPIVAVAPAGQLERRHAAMVAWSRGWLHGVDMVHADPTHAARRVAESEHAPEVVDLIDGLGWIAFASVGDNARMSGLAGRSALHLDTLFARTWDLWRSVGVLTTPAPELAPLRTEVVAEVAVRDDGRHHAAPERTDTVPRASAQPLLVVPLELDLSDMAAEHDLQTEMAFLAAVFSRSELRLAIARNPRAAQRLATRARERHGLRQDRIVTERRPRAKTTATVAVMPVR